jgi:hypothetical protein
MEAIWEWIREQPTVLTVSQIVLDLAVILLVAMAFLRRHRTPPATGHEEVAASFERIMKETQQIAADFDTNLQERQRLLQQVTGRLDSRIQDAERISQRLESLMKDAEYRAQRETPTPSRNSDQQAVLLLAKKGLTQDDIARRLKKPVGEVELILKLHKFSRKEAAP